VNPVGSYCKDVSRCTVNKTLHFFSVWLAYENSQGAMLRNVANDIVYWSKWHHERLKKRTKYFLLFPFDDHSRVCHGYLFIKSNQCNVYVRRTYISLVSTFRSTTRKSRITAVNCRHKFIRHFVTVYTQTNNLQLLRTEFTVWSGWKVPFCNGTNDQWRWRRWWWWGWYTLINWRLLLLLLSSLLYRLTGGGENYNILTLYLRVNDNDGNNTFETYCNCAFKPYFPVWCVVYWHYSTLFLFCDTNRRYSGYWMAMSRRNMTWHDMTWHDTAAT